MWREGAPQSSDHYRLAMPATELARNGIETVVGRTLQAAKRGWRVVNTMRLATPEPDVLVLGRFMDPNAADAVTWAQRRGQVVLADVDDWLFGIDPRNVAHGRTTPYLDHYRRVLSRVDGIIASTPFLAERVAEFNPKVAVARNCIDLERYSPSESARDLGWVGATHWRSGDLETLRGIVSPLLERHDLDFIHGGASTPGNDAAHQLGLDPGRVRFTPGVPTQDYPGFLASLGIGIGVVPLNDIPFNHAKSTCKGMEYAACGIPFVAQALPEYRWMESKGVGVTASKPRQWKRALTDLITDEEARLQLGQRNLEAVAKLDIKVGWTQWVDAITTLTGGKSLMPNHRDVILPPAQVVSSPGPRRPSG